MDVSDPPLVDKIHELIQAVGGASDSLESALAVQLIQTSLKMLLDKTPTGQMKLMTRALKEMRYAYNIFNQYPALRRVSIFGSARTPETHPDYQIALEFSKKMADMGWVCITGAAQGIMKAGLEGAEKDRRFGLSIRLPWENPNSMLEKDPKLIMFRYFFTRKLMFVAHSDAFAAFPGGFGTMDEIFEVLTLMQTGKAEIMPVVLLEGSGGDYWQQWQHYIDDNLLKRGWISPQDQNFYFIAPNADAATQHILHFYRRYHSSRYVKDDLVIRLLTEITDTQLADLNTRFASLIQEGAIQKVPPYPEENDFINLPRLAFKYTKRDLGLLRALIDQLNNYP